MQYGMEQVGIGNVRMLKEKIGNAVLYRGEWPWRSGQDEERQKKLNTQAEWTLEKASGRKEEPDEETRQILEVVSRYDEADYKEQITSRKNWQMMFQLAQTRGNIVEWMEIPARANVLELGAGCGSITSVLLKKGARITCQEENPHYCMANAKRHSQYDTLTIYAMPFAECEPNLEGNFDLVTAVGVPELAKQPEELLEKLRRLLKPDGVLLLAVENKFGLKYWAGNKEPYTGRYYAGLEQDGVRLFSQNGLKDVLAKTGFSQQEFYYPYPDYRFAQDIYSDRHLPQKGDLNYNIANYEDDRILVFDEQKVFDGIIEEGQFPFFSNSYLCLAAKGAGSWIRQKADYVRYASDRGRDYAVRTTLADTQVCKRPLYPQGAAHVAHIAQAYGRLCRQYADTDLLFNRCRMVGTGAQAYAQFDRIHAQALQTQVEQAVTTGHFEQVLEQLKRLMRYIRNGGDPVPFAETEDFIRVFGKIQGLDVLTGSACSQVSDIDLILPNIFVDEDDRWHVIDYEWTFFFPVPQNFIIYRTLFFLHRENPQQKQLAMDRLLKAASISREEAAVYAQMETAFQRFAAGGQTPYREMVNLLGRKYADLVQLKEDFDSVVRQNEILKGKGIWKIARAVKKKLTGNKNI